MVEKQVPLSLFKGYGIEMEYMIVDRETLSVRPIADQLIYSIMGEYVSDVERGTMAWSNELVNHVIELKTNGPTPSLENIAQAFQAEVQTINQLLQPLQAMLMPTGTHPWMDPHQETMLWPHEYNEIYALYDRIFNCQGHGWANLQSTHLNLPFANDQEFGQLHTVIRYLLPIIPALSASTPFLDGKATGLLDSRLEVYRHNQRKMPVLTGLVIPEAVFTEADYHQKIFQPMIEAIQPFDTDQVLEHHFLNSRGAIARFDRQAIEIRIIDIQECPQADIAIVWAIVSVLKYLLNQADLPKLQSWSHQDLAAIFNQVIQTGEQTPITQTDYLSHFGLSTQTITAGEIWNHLYQEVIAKDMPSNLAATLEVILKEGTLATRILKATLDQPLATIYSQLCQCLAEGQLFRP